MTTVKELSDGYHIPIIGFRTFPNFRDEIENTVKLAIDLGYRHLDCAWIYGVDREIGRAVKAKIEEGVIKREDLFITVKLWNSHHEKEKVVQKLRETLSKMDLDYIDLYLMHWPMAFKETVKFPVEDQKESQIAYSDVDYIETWQGMEYCVVSGLARSIGLANFNKQQIERIFKHCTFKPVVNQIEVHPQLSQDKLIKFCQKLNIVVVAYCPLGVNDLSSDKKFAELTEVDKEIDEIGKRHNKTAAQVILNYLWSRGLCVLTNSIYEFKMREYLNSFDFKLKADDVAYLKKCNKNERIHTFGACINHKYYPFHERNSD